MIISLWCGETERSFVRHANSTANVPVIKLRLRTPYQRFPHISNTATRMSLTALYWVVIYRIDEQRHERVDDSNMAFYMDTRVGDPHKRWLCRTKPHRDESYRADLMNLAARKWVLLRREVLTRAL